MPQSPTPPEGRNPPTSTQNQNSSTNPWRVTVCASSPHPETNRFPRCSAFMAETAWPMSPSIRLAFRSSGSVSVRDATYFGMLLIRSANRPSVGSLLSRGQTAARPS